MNTNQNIRNFGGSDTLMLSKINMDASDARVLADLLKDNTTVTKVSADCVKRTYLLHGIMCMLQLSCWTVSCPLDAKRYCWSLTQTCLLRSRSFSSDGEFDMAGLDNVHRSTSAPLIWVLKEARPWLRVSRATPPLHRCVELSVVHASCKMCITTALLRNLLCSQMSPCLMYTGRRQIQYFG